MATNKKKGDRVQVVIECTEQRKTNVPGISRYISTKNRKNTPSKLQLKKYNPYLRKVTVHKEIK
ncbi:MAG: 50S ribosomal protein L33 [Bacteroidales bacterium]